MIFETHFFWVIYTLKLAYPCAARWPTARRSLKLRGKYFPKGETRGSQFAWVDNHRHRHLRGLYILCRVPLPKCETRRNLIHTVQPPLDHDSMLAIVEARTLVILPLAGLQVELILTACSLTRIFKLTEPGMTGTQVFLLVGWPIYGTYWCIYVYMYTYLYEHYVFEFLIHMYIHIHIYPDIHIYIQIYMYMYTYNL